MYTYKHTNSHTLMIHHKFMCVDCLRAKGIVRNVDARGETPGTKCVVQLLSLHEESVAIRKGPSSQYSSTLVPKTIPLMACGTRVLEYWVLDPLGKSGSSGFGGKRGGLARLR